MEHKSSLFFSIGTYKIMVHFNLELLSTLAPVSQWTNILFWAITSFISKCYNALFLSFAGETFQLKKYLLYDSSIAIHSKLKVSNEGLSL